MSLCAMLHFKYSLYGRRGQLFTLVISGSYPLDDLVLYSMMGACGMYDTEIIFPSLYVACNSDGGTV